MRQALWLLVVAGLGAGCLRIDANTRVERGPLLRTFERPQLLEGGVAADVRVEWPRLALTLVGHDVCRALTVEEYAEERITERQAPSVGPALSTGIANVLASAVLLAVSFAVPRTPDTGLIDGGGRYGPSMQQYFQGASLVTLGIGLPALAVGLIGRAQSSDEVEAVRAEQVVSQKDARCNERPVTGPAALVSSRGEVLARPVVDGALDVTAAELPFAPETLRFAEREVELSEDALARFQGYAACVQLELGGAVTLEALSETALLQRAERLRVCRRVRGEAMAEAIQGADDELLRRREAGNPGAFAPGSSVASFEEAIAAYAPSVRLSAHSKDLVLLATPEAVEGRAVLLEGIVAEGVTENIGVVQLGDAQVFLFIPPRRAWTESFPVGTRVEAVALFAGRQTLGERSLPLLRAVWMRTAFGGPR